MLYDKAARSVQPLLLLDVTVDSSQYKKYPTVAFQHRNIHYKNRTHLATQRCLLHCQREENSQTILHVLIKLFRLWLSSFRFFYTCWCSRKTCCLIAYCVALVVKVLTDMTTSIIFWENFPCISPVSAWNSFCLSWNRETELVYLEIHSFVLLLVANLIIIIYILLLNSLWIPFDKVYSVFYTPNSMILKT